MIPGPPPYRTALVGRGDALARLVRTLRAGGALVTLVGPGGVGKTRLAAEAARTFGDDVVYVDLGGARSPEDVGAAALAGAGSTEAGHGALGPRAVAALVSRSPRLVVLDNAEQVLAAVRELAEGVLAARPQVSVCVTSRVPIEAGRERLFEVLPLTTGDEAAQVLLQGLSQVAESPELEPEDIAALLRATDGLPLALELAGARLSVLHPRQLVDGIRQSARTLSDPTRRGRHASMDAAIRWSWDLASPAERDALTQVAAFVGTFDLAAAEAVLVTDPGTTAADVLQALVSASWLRSEAAPDGGRRFRMWDTVRTFLHDFPAPDGVAHRFQAWFAEWAEAFARRSTPNGLAAELATADPDLSNALAAIELGGPDAARICVSLNRLLIRRLERRRCAHLWLRVAEVAAPEHRLALYACATDDLAVVGEVDLAVEAGLRARAAVLPGTPPSQIVRVAVALATAQLHSGACDAAASTLAEVVPLADGMPPPVRSRLFMDLGNLAHDLGRSDEASRWIDAAPPLIDAIVDRNVRETYSLRLGILEIRARRVSDGERRLSNIVDAADPATFALTLCAAWCYRAVARWLQGDADGADGAWAKVDGFRVPGVHEAVHRSIRAAATWARWPDRARADAVAALDLIDANDHASLETYCRPLVRSVLAVAGVLSSPPPPRRRIAGAYPFVPRAVATVDDLLAGRLDAAGGRAVAGELEALPSFEAFLFAAVVRGAVQVADRVEHTWSIAVDGSAFRAPAAPWVDLTRRPRMAAILRTLVGRPAPIGVAALFDEVWVGERALPDAAANRVRVTVSQLRSLGLTLVQFRSGGYRLDPTVPVRIDRPPDPPE